MPLSTKSDRRTKPTRHGAWQKSKQAEKQRLLDARDARVPNRAEDQKKAAERKATRAKVDADTKKKSAAKKAPAKKAAKG